MTEAKRGYFTRHPEIVTEEQRLYYAKIQDNQDAGWKVLSSGEYTPFRGWSKDASDRTFDIILELDKSSQYEIIKRVVEPLRKLALAHHITAIYPGYGDLPPHVVLQPGKFTNLTQEQIDTTRDWFLSSGSHLDQLEEILRGKSKMGGKELSDKKPLSFRHGSLVIARDSYVCASYFDEEQGVIFRARKFIEERVQARALKNLKTSSQVPDRRNFAPPNSYYALCHSSVMRLREKANPRDAIEFAQEAYSIIGEDLNKNPIPVTVENLYRGIATDYHEQVPNLILP